MARTLFARKALNLLHVFAVSVTKGTDTTVQVRIYGKTFGFVVRLTPPSHFVMYVLCLLGVVKSLPACSYLKH